MTVKISFKRGDTFALQATVSQNVDDVVTPIDITDWTIRSQLRLGNTLVAELTVTKPDPVNGVYQLRKTDTTTWKPTVHHCDVEYTDENGSVVSTETFEISVVADVTR